MVEDVRNVLAGRTAIVTGSSRNLGAEIARHLAGLGANVTVTYHSARGEGEALVSALEHETGTKHLLVGCDLAKGDDVRGLIRACRTEFGGVDVLVNNVGPWAGDPFHELSEELWDHVIDTNLKAAFIAAREVAPIMRESGWGRVINVSAGSAFVRNHSVYGLAKGALIFLTEELALELGPEVTVNAIAPGQIAESAAEAEAFDPTLIPRTLERTAVGRLVTRREVADMVALLCGPQFDTVTGVTLPMDGGWRLNRF